MAGPLDVVGAVGSGVRAVVDLVLPRECGGCGRPGGWWCGGCASVTRVRPVVAALPDGSTTCTSGAPYDGPGGRALVALKERSAVALRDPLAGLLAAAVDHVVGEAVRSGGVVPAPVVLVPVPSRGAAVRARGEDVVARLAARAAAQLRAAGLDVVVVRVLRHRRRVADQAGLGRVQRRANVAGALAVRAGARAERVRTARLVVVVDDVVTSGATLVEACRALRATALVGELRAATALRAGSPPAEAAERFG